MSFNDFILFRERLVYEVVTDAQILNRLAPLGHMEVGPGQAVNLEVSTILLGLVGVLLRISKKKWVLNYSCCRHCIN